LFANAIFGILHIGAAIYVVHKIREPVRGHPSASGNDGVYTTGYRLHDPRDQKSKHDVGAAAAANATPVYNPSVVPASVTGNPDSFRRIRHVLCESKVFAAYISVYLAYLCWHFFLNMRACNLGMAFAMRCADIFIWASPCSFVFSVGTLMHQQGRL
jgi:hypothetical protein